MGDINASEGTCIAILKNQTHDASCASGIHFREMLLSYRDGPPPDLPRVIIQATLGRC